jgi:hypothetical protein
MTFPTPPEARFASTVKGLLTRVGLLEQRTQQFDSGTLLQTVTGVVDPAYTAGQPMVTVTGSAALTGPYQCVSSYVPVAGDSVLLLPSGATYIVIGLTPPAWPLSVQGFDGTNFTFSTTTYAAGAPACSASIVAPASGSMYVTVTTRVSNNTAGQSSLLSFEVHVTNSGGAIVLAGSDDRAVQLSSTGNQSASFRYLLTGLTPGTAYYAQTLHRVTGGTGTFLTRQITMEPVVAVPVR